MIVGGRIRFACTVPANGRVLGVKFDDESKILVPAVDRPRMSGLSVRFGFAWHFSSYEMVSAEHHILFAPTM